MAKQKRARRWGGMLSPETLRKKIAHPSAHEKRVFWNLAKYGASASCCGVPGLDLTLDQTLAEALPMSRRFSSVTHAWIHLYASTARKVDLDALESTARKRGCGAVLGFLLNMTRVLTKTRTTKTEIRLADTKSAHPEEFYLPRLGRAISDLAEIRSPQVARKWNFRMLTTLEHFKEEFSPKWAKELRLMRRRSEGLPHATFRYRTLRSGVGGRNMRRVRGDRRIRRQCPS